MCILTSMACAVPLVYACTVPRTCSIDFNVGQKGATMRLFLAAVVKAVIHRSS